MQSHASTDPPQPESHNSPFQGVNTSATSVSQGGGDRQHSGFQSIDSDGTLTNLRQSNTFPSNQARAGSPGTPHVTPAAIPDSPKGHVAVTIMEPDPGHPTGGIENSKREESLGGVTASLDHREDTGSTVNPLYHIPRERGRDYIRVIPTVIYQHLLLRLPGVYFSRVDRVFWGAQLSTEEIKGMALQEGYAEFPRQHAREEMAERSSQRYQRLQVKWDWLIDRLMEEWKTLNTVSVLLLGVIMTMFQIDGAARDPITRYLAFCSMICALISLLHSCTLIVRFSPMRQLHRAAEWARVVRLPRYRETFWNVWIMLSMPLLWLIWSIVTFIICIMTFMWRSRAELPEGFVFSVSSHTEIGAQIFVSAILGCGALYTVLIFKTLRKYGTQMDEEWKERIDKYLMQNPSPPLKLQGYASGAPTREPLATSSVKFATTAVEEDAKHQ